MFQMSSKHCTTSLPSTIKAYCYSDLICITVVASDIVAGTDCTVLTIAPQVDAIRVHMNTVAPPLNSPLGIHMCASRVNISQDVSGAHLDPGVRYTFFFFWS